MYSKDDLGQTIVFGTCELNLKSLLLDQLVHDHWIRLKGDLECTGNLHLQLQWIYSEVLFCTEAIKTFDEALNLHQQQIDNLQHHLQMYREPFKHLLDINDS